MDRIPELHFYDIAETAERLHMPPDVLRNNAHEMHVLMIPEGARRFPNHYVDAIIDSDQWSEPKGRRFAMASFAGSLTAHQCIVAAEFQLEEHIQSIASANDTQLLKSRDIARLFDVQPRTVSRWRNEGYLPPAIRQSTLALTSPAGLRQAYAWQRPQSYPYAALPHTAARLTPDTRHASKELLPAMPETVKFTDAQQLLGVTNNVLVTTSKYLHRFRTVHQTDMRYPSAPLRQLAATEAWESHRASRADVAQAYASTPEAVSTMEATEQAFAAAVDVAFQRFGPELPNYVASHLLGVHAEAIAYWRAKGKLDPALPMNRQTFDSLYYWQRPGEE